MFMQKINSFGCQCSLVSEGRIVEKKAKVKRKKAKNSVQCGAYRGKGLRAAYRFLGSARNDEYPVSSIESLYIFIIVLGFVGHLAEVVKAQLRPGLHGVSELVQFGRGHKGHLGNHLFSPADLR